MTGQRGPRALVVLAIWTLTFLVFSAPGRETPTGLGSLDLIAIAKVSVRAFLLVAFAGVIAASWSLPRRAAVVKAFAPYCAFACWAVVSVTWSPLKAISVGQVAGLLLMCEFSLVAALLWRGPADTEWLLKHMVFALLVASAVLTAVDLVAHDLSGLNRAVSGEVEFDEAAGIVHPTTAGATASLGLLLVMATRVIWQWPWARRAMVPAVLIHGYVLLQAESRTAIFITTVLGLLLVLRSVRGIAYAVAGVAASLAMVLYLALDPGLTAVTWTLDTTTAYLQRGESVEQLSTATGRTDLWRAIWASYQDAPVLGHGYFVTSHDGLLDVWSGPANRTAHNVFLQVLVTTGAVGVVLFLVGLGRLTWAGVKGLLQHADASPTAWFLVGVAMWYAVWGTFSESFMGPVQAESVLFYLCLGILAGHVPQVSSLSSERAVVVQLERAGAY